MGAGRVREAVRGTMVLVSVGGTAHTVLSDGEWRDGVQSGTVQTCVFFLTAFVPPAWGAWGLGG